MGILNQNTGQREGFSAQNNLEMVIGSVVQDEVLEGGRDVAAEGDVILAYDSSGETAERGVVEGVDDVM